MLLSDRLMLSGGNISFIAAGTVQQGVNPATVPIPTGYSVGDLLIIISSSTGTGSTPSGWTSFQLNQGNVAAALCGYYKIATSSESSVSVTTGNTKSSAVMLCYRGNSSSPLDVNGTVASAGSGTSLSTSSITTIFSNDLVLSIYGCAQSVITFTSPASTNTRVNAPPTASATGLLLVDEIKITAGSTTVRTATISSSRPWSAVATSFKPS